MEYRLAVAIEFYVEKGGFHLESIDKYFKANRKDEAIKKAKRYFINIYRANKNTPGFLRAYASLFPVPESIWYRWINKE